MSNAGAPCQQPNECPEATCGDELPCASDTDCFQPRELCEQRNDGAFGKDAATTITMTGTPAGSISDRAEHTGTLLSTFCIPPTFAPSIDVVAALPGPGATSFPSKIRLRP